MQVGLVFSLHGVYSGYGARGVGKQTPYCVCSTHSAEAAAAASVLLDQAKQRGAAAIRAAMVEPSSATHAILTVLKAAESVF